VSWQFWALERGLLPDSLIRFGIRRLLAARRRELAEGGKSAMAERQAAFVEQLRGSPLALEVERANQQHYELPPAFFEHVLGPHLKYSCGLWPTGRESLEESEHAMLELSAARAEIEDGQKILELGCGWGSMTLFLAAHFPGAKILGVSNSALQRQFILKRAQERGLTNVEIVTADMNHFNTDRRFDRVVSIEMFEHMRNYGLLLERIADWLQPGGKLFVHVFCHREVAYPFEVRDESDWMARYFFTGGVMPSFDLIPSFARRLSLDTSWRVPGTHYQRTSEAWLAQMDRRRAEIWPILQQTYGSDQVRRWHCYWRVFFMACAELFGASDGREWLVAHYLFNRNEGPIEHT
jgi:cyclopropane-fatty-acyl-phospholipid synthase